MPRKRQTRRVRREKPKPPTPNDNGEQQETSDTENSLSRLDLQLRSAKLCRSPASLNLSGESAAGPSRVHLTTESSSASESHQNGVKCKPRKPVSSSDPLSSAYNATGPSTSSSSASISFPTVYHFLGPSSSSSAAGSPLHRRRIFFLGGSSTPSVSFTPDMGQSSLEDLVAAAEIELARLREEASRGHGSSDDEFNRTRRPRRYTF